MNKNDGTYIDMSIQLQVLSIYVHTSFIYTLPPQNKEGILPVATLSIAIYVLRRFMSASDIAPEVASLSLAL